MTLIKTLADERDQLDSKLTNIRRTATALYKNPHTRLIGLQLFNDLGEIPPKLENE
jgi:hypothetical protein